ncbi:hypothetical protein C448_02044 [Halococcus morrhuae DSM 1307]|uniref:Uncharacterized protein n=1 Tax=Halococcus morrhuae DSM 1307 TaxID=931277 RepID=M0MW87_HALMO|nr:hypothetical protein [Halococcus morrhuae]EMA49084.1 hypothetical protein C448_02044 [Halococcus morrhuae DSM 1307]
MCIYCSYDMEGWGKLLDYDDTYQEVVRDDETTDANYGFHESWDDLREQVSP